MDLPIELAEHVSNLERMTFKLGFYYALDLVGPALKDGGVQITHEQAEDLFETAWEAARLEIYKRTNFVGQDE